MSPHYGPFGQMAAASASQTANSQRLQIVALEFVVLGNSIAANFAYYSVIADAYAAVDRFGVKIHIGAAADHSLLGLHSPTDLADVAFRTRTCAEEEDRKMAETQVADAAEDTSQETSWDTVG